MPDSFTITIVFIILSALVATFIRGRTRDRCLRDFEGNMVTIERTDGAKNWGKMRLETTGLELVYPKKHQDTNGFEESSCIVYKTEYPHLQAVIRYHDELSDKRKKERERELKKTYHPAFLRRLGRRIQNILKTVRDSFLEVVNLLISQAKKTGPAGGMLSSQDKYVNKMKQEMVGTVGTSFEPLLEKYIGHKVILELIKGDQVRKYSGVLKDYTSEFVEVMDVQYRIKEDNPFRTADLVVLRRFGIIRHLGE